MSTSTIEITEGAQERTSRLGLKKTMLAFGEVDACHMGDRAVMGDRFTEFPIVRFKTQSSAETALKALKAGQVYLDGFQLNGEWRGGGGQAVRQRKGPATPALAAQPWEETSSRLLWETPTGTNSQGRTTFAGRDQRRSDREEETSRSLFEAPPQKRAPRSPPPRQRSRTPPRPKRRSPSRRSPSRRRKRSRSGSAKKRGGSMLTTLILMKPRDPRSLGNAEGALSDNPLYCPPGGAARR